MSQAPVVYVVDDDPSIVRALQRLFRVAGLRMVSFDTAGGFLDQSDLQSPACLVLDVHLPDLSGLDLQKAMLDRGWNLPIVFVTGHGNVPMAVEAMRAGAIHFFPKPFANRELLAAVHQALEREAENLARHEAGQRIRQLVDTLTPRERQVFLLVATGMANKNIGARLGISLPTVKLHRGNVMEKLQLVSVADLVQLAEKVRGFMPEFSTTT